jgi:hypothetical protein
LGIANLPATTAFKASQNQLKQIENKKVDFFLVRVVARQAIYFG